MTDSDEYWNAVVWYLWKARNSWKRMLIIFGRGGVNKRVPGIFFKVVVKSVLLLGLEMWVITPCMGWDLGGFTTQGGSTDHWEASLEVIGQGLVISTDGYGDAGSKVLIYGGICAEEA